MLRFAAAAVPDTTSSPCLRDDGNRRLSCQATGGSEPAERGRSDAPARPCRPREAYMRMFTFLMSGPHLTISLATKAFASSAVPPPACKSIVENCDLPFGLRI